MSWASNTAFKESKWIPDGGGGGAPAPVQRSTLFTRGRNQTINFGNVLDWTGATPRTFAAQVKPSAAGSAIMGKGSISAVGWLWWYYVANTVAIEMVGGADLIAMTFPVAGIQDGNWHSLILTVNGSKTAAGNILYYDGVAQPPTVFVDTLTNSISNSSAFIIGDDPTGDPFAGNIFVPLQFNVSLNATEAAELALLKRTDTVGTHSRAANIIGGWGMGSGSDTTSTYFDLFGTNNGTPVNIAAGDIVSDVP